MPVVKRLWGFQYLGHGVETLSQIITRRQLPHDLASVGCVRDSGRLDSDNCSPSDSGIVDQ